MTTDNSKTLNTLEELATLAVAEGTRGYKRTYKLAFNLRYEYVDAAAGEAWDAAAHAVHSWDVEKALRGERDWHEWERSDDYKKYEANYTAWCKANPSPEKHNVRYYSLFETGRSDRNHSVKLGADLGEQLLGIWATKDGRPASYDSELRGQMTLEGMLKRLGKTDIGAAVKTAKAAAEAEAAKNQRNHSRERMLATLAELEREATKANELGIALNLDIITFGTLKIFLTNGRE